MLLAVNEMNEILMSSSFGYGFSYYISYDKKEQIGYCRPKNLNSSDQEFARIINESSHITKQH